MKRILVVIFSFLNVGVATAQNKPNFLFILTDDQTYRSIRALNNPEIHTPNMDKLVEQGVTFTHTFNQGSWTGAVCVASRTMLITGQRVFKAPRNEAYLGSWARLKNNKKKTEVPLWQEVFRENGYQTFFTGKWHNSEYALLKSFDCAKAIGKGFYETTDENGERVGYLRGSADSDWHPADRKYKGHWSPEVKDIVYDEKDQKKTGPDYAVNQHTSELYADQAIHFIRNVNRTGSKPFFMFVSFNAPHDPRQSPQEFVNMYPPSSVQVPVNYLAEHPFDQGDSRIRDELLAPFPRTEEAVQLHRSEYYAIISHFDNELGRIMKALEHNNLLENTYVILSSDHGLAVGEHGLMGKQNQYEHSIRVPLVIKGPGLPANRKVNDKVYLQSLFATTCELASVKVPGTVEFKSIKNLLEGRSGEGEEYIFGAYRHLQRMIRSDDYKLIVYPAINKMQLFNVKEDPFETTDISGRKEFKEIKNQLCSELACLQKEFGDFIITKNVD